MKFLKAVLGLSVFIVFLICSGSQFSSCTKKQVIQDTIIVKDTTTVRDTTITVDSVYDLTAGLVAYYNFTGGTLADSSGYGNNIIFNNATKTSDRFGRPNNAYLFDGSTSYMEVTNSPSLNPDNGITMMAIVKVNGFDTGSCHENQILGKLSSDPTDGIYALRFNDLTTACSVSPNTAVEQFVGYYGDDIPEGSAAIIASNPATPVQKGQWYNLVYTYDGTYAKMYVNGVLQTTQQISVSFTPNVVDLYIGETPNPTFPYYFNGVIDEVRIYNRPLSANEIKQLNLVQE
jgi:hypothetical protein